MSAEFDRLYADSGRPSIPPERLLKASLLIALYSVRSDRVFWECSITISCSAGFWT
jgi:transposase